MSHIVTLNVSIKDKAVLKEVAVRDFGLTVKDRETVTFFDYSAHSGMTIRLPGWEYPVLVTDEGELIYDNYEGQWGDQAQLNQLIQNYVVACVYKAGVTAVTSEVLPDGTVKMRLPAMAFAGGV